MIVDGTVVRAGGFETAGLTAALAEQAQAPERPATSDYALRRRRSISAVQQDAPAKQASDVDRIACSITRTPRTSTRSASTSPTA